MTVSANAWIGLGANLGDPRAQLDAALAAIGELAHTRLLSRSSYYRTPPMGPPGQPDYLNAVAGVETALTPEALLEALLAIETRLGRRRDGQVWGPRVIDLDLLCYGEQRRDTAFLRLPHPGLRAGGTGLRAQATGRGGTRVGDSGAGPGGPAVPSRG